MPSNTLLNLGTGGEQIVTRTRNHDGESDAQVQGVFMIGVTGSTEDAYTWTDIEAGDGSETNAIRVVHANDVEIAINDGGNLITVDGTVNVGGDALTSLQTIDNYVYVDDATALSGSASIAGIGAVATPTDTNVDANEFGALAMSVDRRLHVDADIVTQSVGNLDVNLAADALDLMTGTDFSDVMGTTSLVTTGALADAVANTQDVLNVRNFNYIYNGSTFDLMQEGSEAGSVLVDLGANNDVTVTGTVTVDDPDLDDIPNVIGTDNTTGPTRCLSIGGTDSGTGNIQEIAVDSDGQLQVDVLSGGGGTQYNISDVAGGTDAGMVALAIRQDTQSDLGADGDWVALSIDAAGALRVTGAGGGTEYTYDVAVPAAPVGKAIMAERIDTPSTITPVQNDWSHLLMSAEGCLWVEDQNSDAIATDIGNIDTNIGTLAGAVQTEDAAHITADTGFMVFGVRQDTASALADNGDYIPFSVDANGSVRVNMTNAEGTATDDAAFTEGTDTIAVVGGFFDDAAAVTSGDAGALRMTAQRALYVSHETPAGDTMVDDTNDALRVNVVTGSTAGTEYTEDAAFTTAAGGAHLMIREDAPSSIAVDNDWVAQRCTEYGSAYTQIVTSAGAFVDSFGGGTEYTEDVATADPIVGTATMMERDDTLGTLTPVEGDWAGMRCSAEGALWVQDFNSDAILADTGNMDTNLGTIAGAVDSGQMQVDVVASLPAGTNNIGDVDIASALPAGTNNIGDVDVLSVVPGTGATDLGKARAAAYGATDTGVAAMVVRNDDLADLAGADGDYTFLQVDEFGALYVTDRSESMYRNIDANAEDAIKTSAGTLNWLHVMNMTAAVAYLHLYNDTTGNVNPGTTTPDLTFPIPTQGDTNGAGFNIKLNQYFDTAITLVVTTTNDGAAGDPGTNGVFVNAGYV